MGDPAKASPAGGAAAGMHMADPAKPSGAAAARVADPHWREHAFHVLSSAGHRNAQARRTLVDFLDEQPCALTAREIDDALRAQGRGVGLATVYRNLELLVDLKLVGRLDVGQGVTRYERLLPSGEHHHH